MELRTILFGYKKEQFAYFIEETEAQLVREIFTRYISGETLLQIANDFTVRQVTYYKGKNTWTKNAIRRIIENEHYCGDMDYPPIIKKEEFIEANSKRLLKGGTREKDSKEIAWLKEHSYCEQCGKRFSRRSHWSHSREKWGYGCGCSQDVYIDDAYFFNKINTVINKVINAPKMLSVDDATKRYKPTLDIIREGKEINRIFFEEQNINSLEEESETYLGIYSVMAQSESENISSNVKWGITKRMQNGTYSCRFNFLGYRKDKGESEPRIIPEEAEIVRHIFKMYVEGGSIDQIKAYLEGNHIKTVQGKDTWDKTVIRHMLQNEKYVGDVLYQKTFRTDCISKHTKINRGERTKYLVSNNHPAIIDRETFKAVQSEMVRRSSKRKTSDFAITNLGKYSGKYALSELLVCGECGSLYKRKTWTKGEDKRIYWRCQNRIEHGSKYCKKSKGIEEKRLHEAICRALRKMVEESASVISLIKADLAYGLSGDEGTYDVGALEKSISDATTDLNDYMKQYNSTGGDKTKYIECIQQTSEKIRLLRIELDTAKAKISQNEKINQEVERLTKWLTEHDVSFESYDDVVVRRMVELVRVNNDNTITVFSKFGSEIVENL